MASVADATVNNTISKWVFMAVEYKYTTVFHPAQEKYGA